MQRKVNHKLFVPIKVLWQLPILLIKNIKQIIAQEEEEGTWRQRTIPILTYVRHVVDVNLNDTEIGPQFWWSIKYMC